MNEVVMTIGLPWSTTSFMFSEVILVFKGGVGEKGWSTIASTISYVVGIPQGDMTIGCDTKWLASLLLPFFRVKDWEDSIFFNHFLEHNCMHHQ